MKSLRLGCIPILLILSSSLTAQDHSTPFLLLMQQDSPARFVGTRNNVKEDLLKSATLQNVGDAPLTGYRIGWVAVYGDDRDKVGLGLPVSVPEGLGFGPGQMVAVPAQGVSPNLVAEGASAIVFFVAEVHSANHATWRPELEQIEGQARQMAALLLSH
jgi:hypothetical protein